jgi:hypothetical protein
MYQNAYIGNFGRARAARLLRRRTQGCPENSLSLIADSVGNKGCALIAVAGLGLSIVQENDSRGEHETRRVPSGG